MVLCGCIIHSVAMSQMRKEMMGQHDPDKDRVKGLFNRIIQQNVVEKKLVKSTLMSVTPSVGQKRKPDKTDSYPTAKRHQPDQRSEVGSPGTRSWGQPKSGGGGFGGSGGGFGGSGGSAGPKGGCFSCGGPHLQRHCPQKRSPPPPRLTYSEPPMNQNPSLPPPPQNKKQKRHQMPPQVVRDGEEGKNATERMLDSYGKGRWRDQWKESEWKSGREIMDEEDGKEDDWDSMTHRFALSHLPHKI